MCTCTCTCTCTWMMQYSYSVTYACIYTANSLYLTFLFLFFKGCWMCVVCMWSYNSFCLPRRQPYLAVLTQSLILPPYCVSWMYDCIHLLHSHMIMTTCSSKLLFPSMASSVHVGYSQLIFTHSLALLTCYPLALSNIIPTFYLMRVSTKNIHKFVHVCRHIRVFAYCYLLSYTVCVIRLTASICRLQVVSHR